MNLTFTRDANADLDDIWEYSRAKWGAVRAADYLDRIADRAEALARGEVSGTSEDAIRPGLRRQVVETHVIWFRVEHGMLTVLRVLHQSRDEGVWVG
jgi:toxin ParE1/3/4